MGDAILPFYENRLKQIEKIIVEQQIVTLPDRPARIRIATAAETAQQPAPHMVPPPFIHNTGQKGEFVLPLNIPAGPGQVAAEQYDDFTFDAAAWTLTAHEARPGHELQFDSMLEHGVSLARVRYAFNSTNVEGWGLVFGISHQALHAARRPVDLAATAAAARGARLPRSGAAVRQDHARRTPSACWSRTWCCRTPSLRRKSSASPIARPDRPTATSTATRKLISLREDTEKALSAKGVKFDQKKFHDFILAQGLLPPDLMRKAVMENFVPAQKK